MPSALFPDLGPEPLDVRFDTPAATSDGGAALLAALDRRIALIAAVVGAISDSRDPNRVTHSLAALLRQRVYLLALGYFDCNDSDRLRDDPLLRLLLDRAPDHGPGLASQPTLSRFENSFDSEQLDAMERAFAQAVIDRCRQRRGSARVITIDFDPTCDPTHGSQQGTLFNGFYGTWCYLPLVGLVSFDNEAEQWVVAAHLRGGCAPARQGFLNILGWLLPMLRAAFPKARLRVRLDSGFQGGELLSYLQAENVEVVLCLAQNKVLARLSAPLVERLRAEWAQYEKDLARYRQERKWYWLVRLAARGAPAGQLWTRRKGPRQPGQPGKPRKPRRPRRPAALRYGQVLYGAGRWERRWRVLLKVERVECAGREPKINVRYVLTDVQGSARRIYERIYCPRGDAENRIKELKEGLGLDRTSCHRFEANRLRALLAAMAYALLQELRWQARGTSLARAQAGRLQICLLKLAGWVERTAGRWRVHLPRQAPWLAEWLAVAGRLGAVATP